MQKHLEREFDSDVRAYFVERETGKFLGESVEDFELKDDMKTDYVKIMHNASVPYECSNCGYSGNRYIPHRNKPTLEAPLHKKCPNTDCRMEVTRDT
jgi:hypothetical protein